MKRLAGLLLIAWCTAFAQVQPAVAVLETSGCCCENCSCGPDCAPVATLPGNTGARATAVADEGAIKVERKAPQATARAQLPAPHLRTLRPELVHLPEVTFADPVPAFARHCVFLI